MALAVVAYLSVLAAPASAEFDWTGTAGPCGGDITTPPAGDPLADAAASQWYACWTATEHFERQLEAFGYRDPVEFDPETDEPTAWDDYTPGQLAWESIERQTSTLQQIEQLLAAVRDPGGATAQIEWVGNTIVGLQGQLGYERRCDDPGWDAGPDRCDDPEPDQTEWVNSGETLEEIRHLLIDIRDQGDEAAATVEIDPEDLEPIVLASEQTRDSFVETIWGSNGLWIGLAFLVVFWRVVRPGRT